MAPLGKHEGKLASLSSRLTWHASSLEPTPPKGRCQVRTSRFLRASEPAARRRAAGGEVVALAGSSAVLETRLRHETLPMPFKKGPYYMEVQGS